MLYTEYQKVDHKTSGCPFRFTKGILYVWGLKMAIKNFSEIKQLIDIGMEKGYLTPDEINDFLPQNIFSPEEIEDIFDFLSESNIDIVETIKEKVEPEEEEVTVVEEVPLVERVMDVEDMETSVPEMDFADAEVEILAADEEVEEGEIAGVLEVPVGTVKSRLHNGKRALKAVLEREASRHE